MIIKKHWSTDMVDHLRDEEIISLFKNKYGKNWKKRIKYYFKEGCRMKDRYAKKIEMENIIKTYTVNDKIAFVYGGVDCDGGMWNNKVRLIPNPSINKLLNVEHEYYFYAEGSQWHQYMKVEDAVLLTESNRDLAMESFENGHSHTIRI